MPARGKRSFHLPRLFSFPSFSVNSFCFRARPAGRFTKVTPRPGRNGAPSASALRFCHLLNGEQCKQRAGRYCKDFISFYPFNYFLHHFFSILGNMNNAASPIAAYLTPSLFKKSLSACFLTVVSIPSEFVTVCSPIAAPICFLN